MLCLNSGSASSEGPDLCGLRRRVLQRDLVKWDGLAFGAFPGCVTRCFTLTSQLLPTRPVKVTVYANFCLSFSFFGSAKNPGICEAVKDSSSAFSKNREKKEHLEEPSDWDSLRTALWRNWPSNAPLKDADPELRHSKWLREQHRPTYKPN